MTKSELQIKNRELIETVDNLNEVIKNLNETIEDLSKNNKLNLKKKVYKNIQTH